MTDVSAPSPGSSFNPLRDRMARWPNDDLLLKPEIRALMAVDYPQALRVFDWEALRDAFGDIDKTANKKRRDREFWCVVAVLTAWLGAALAGLLPILDLLGGNVSKPAFAAAALISLFGLVWTIAISLVDPTKAAWLQTRLQTERLRQFYFQFMISDPQLAIEAMSDDDALKRWQAKRDDATTWFNNWLKLDMRAELGKVLDDVNHRDVWMQGSWNATPAPPTAPQGETFFEFMLRQRMGVQRHYVREKLARNINSPRTRQGVYQFFSFFLAFSAATLSIIGAFYLWTAAPPPPGGGEAIDSVEFRFITCAIALIGVTSIALKVLSDGLQLKTDVERYQWYDAAVEEIEGAYNNPDPAHRIEVLREMEAIAYRELRDFLKTHEDARFSFV